MTALDYIRNCIDKRGYDWLQDYYIVADEMETYLNIKTKEQALQLKNLETLVSQFNSLVEKIPIEEVSEN